jgi:hypothetical protein
MVRRKRLAANRAGGTAFRTTGADACGFPGAASLRFLKGAGLDAIRSTTMANSARRSFSPINAGSAILPCTRPGVFSLRGPYPSPYFDE